MSVLLQRVTSGVVIGASLLGAMILDGWLAERFVSEPPRGGFDVVAWLCNGAVSTFIILALALMCAREVTHFLRTTGYRPNRLVAQFFAAGLVVGPYLMFNLDPDTPWRYESWGMLWISLALFMALVLQAARRGAESAAVNVAAVLFVIVYVGGLAGYMTRLRMEIGGAAGVLVLFFSVFIVKANDMGAFFTGRAFGKHKLIPWLSPKKTWEGFAGGLLASVLMSVLIGPMLPEAVVEGLRASPLGYPWGFIWFGLLMGLLSVAGDLAASLLKRDAHMKDSGAVIPGMGGVLDILDSPLLAAPAAWFFWTRLAG